MDNSKAIRSKKSIGTWLRIVPAKTGHLFTSLVKNVFKIGVQSIAILILVVITIAPLVYWLTMPIPTKIQADLMVDHVSFRLGATTDFRQAIKFHSATFREFEQVQFTPLNQGEALNTVHITGKNERLLPTLSLTTLMPDTTHFGVLHKLTTAKGAKIALSIKPGEGAYQALGIAIENDPNSLTTPLAILQHRGAFQVKTRHCQIDGIEYPTTFEVGDLSRRNPAIAITGQTDTLRIMLSVPANQDFDIVPSGLSITDLDLFWDEMVKGQRVVTTAVKQGEISYLTYSNVEPVSFGASKVSFGKADTFKIEKITYDANSKSLKIRLNGLAKNSIRTYLPDFPDNDREYRLTRADTIAKASKFSQVMFDILLWIIPIIIGVVGIVAITRIKLSDDDLTRLAKKLNKQN
ncbi:hypothetical protein [Candidatus Parabeggiatoa sp. HSG14]|uniref:hypothetical protein n=1 Tax=Candidatus Parabeggiatoa sp. HSG14 TaxID=3055593 RepID=UPI0025A86F50|nr:hypothetical protein [Thiotrichales bacterium HSG14]